nr:trophozoite cysteine proteinase [Leptinotarsa decemlineata]
MHLRILVFLCVVAFAMAQLLSDEEEWNKFKSKHEKSYESSSEEARRFEIFKENLKKIREHNKRYDAGKESYYQGVNQFTDLTPEEFKDRYTGGFKGRKDQSVSHGKSYANKEEEAKRRAIFETHLREVEEHNRKYDNGEVTWRMGINRFSDLTPEEMKIYNVFFFSYTFFTISMDSQLSAEEEWKKFKSEHSKSYSTPEEETRRLAIFKTNLNEIREHNKKYDAGEESYFLGINQFADLTKEESNTMTEYRDILYLLFYSARLVLVSCCWSSLVFPNYQRSWVLSVVMATQLSLEEQWKNFKSEHGKSYPTPEEETRRFEIFKNNLNKIREHNERYDAGEESYFMGINQFADLTDEEFRNQNLGLEEEQD